MAAATGRGEGTGGRGGQRGHARWAGGARLQGQHVRAFLVPGRRWEQRLHCGQARCYIWENATMVMKSNYRLSPRRPNLNLFLRSRVCFSGNQTWGDGKGCLRAAQNSLYHDLYVLPARAMPHDPPRHRPAAVRPEHHQCLIWGSQSSKSL